MKPGEVAAQRSVNWAVGCEHWGSLLRAHLQTPAWCLHSSFYITMMKCLAEQPKEGAIYFMGSWFQRFSVGLLGSTNPE